jgi:molybdenum cofactor biosynthesis enzyme MoaA
MMNLETVRGYLAQAAALGVREYYFTGGEPFLNRELIEMLEETPGTFDRIMSGVAHLAEAGINPVLTVTEACEGAASATGRTRFLEFLRAVGLRQPRLKVMPLLRLGAERERTRAYAEWESLAGRTLTPEEAEALQCSSSRMVTAKGVYVCPILIDSPGARMASSLAGALRPFELSHRACYTCHEQGLSCRT